MTSDPSLSNLAVVAIGRNEGERLKACLRSIPKEAVRIYVDSGSTDGSVAFAAQEGVTVVNLPPHTRFTAALARNAGLAALPKDVDFVQMIDGDCELDAHWLNQAREALRADPGLAVVFGRRRERFPERSVYNRMCDDEWNVPVGEAMSCGGDALFRRAALAQVGGYDARYIAGEEPDLCQRLRQRNWRIRRIDAEMTRHDAAITRFRQWWRRTERSGHAFAELAWRHGAAGDPHWRREVRSIVAWGVVLPVVILIAWVTIGWWMALILSLLYPAQMVRIAIRKRRQLGLDPAFARSLGMLLVLGKFAQTKGAALFHWRRMAGRKEG